MTDRERLLEILNVPIYPHENVDPVEAVADYLLDNGVTFQKWIPVTEQLPEDNKKVIVLVANKIEVIACYEKMKACPVGQAFSIQTSLPAVARYGDRWGWCRIAWHRPG